MDFRLFADQDTLVLRFNGALTKVGAKRILRLLRRRKILNGSDLIFDLTHASSIDSYGLGIIFLLAHRLRQTGGHTSVMNPQPQVRESLEKADLPSMVHLFPTKINGTHRGPKRESLP